jgi:riboflavin synthase
VFQFVDLGSEEKERRSVMFSGIVEEMGIVQKADLREGGLSLRIRGKSVLEGTILGDSIAVNGVCLTVVAYDAESFSVEVVPESLKRSNLGALAVGDRVNLERALLPNRPIGGHGVQGHVDATAVVIAKIPEGDAQNYTFRAPLDLMRYIVPKGYVAIDGASLTVVDTHEDTFSVTLIPHTQEATVIGAKGVGYQANLEVDIIGKYIERAFGDRLTQLEARIAKLEAEKKP